MRHTGHSGFGLIETLSSDGFKVIRKWTTGPESEDLLRKSHGMQMLETFKGELYPVRAVHCTPIVKGEDSIHFDMPYLRGESGFTVSPNINIAQQIIESLRHRSMNVMTYGFFDKITDEVMRIGFLEDAPYTIKMRNIIFDELALLPDSFPQGYAHGDFGFANMIIEEGRVYMVDFTPSFIDSPLMDLATMELSLSAREVTPWHRAIFATAMTHYRDFEKHKDIVRMTKVLSYFRDSDTPERRAHLEDLFHGRFNRKANI